MNMNTLQGVEDWCNALFQSLKPNQGFYYEVIALFPTEKTKHLKTPVQLTMQIFCLKALSCFLFNANNANIFQLLKEKSRDF